MNKWREAIAHLTSDKCDDSQRTFNLTWALEAVDEKVAIAAIDDYLDGMKTHSYKLGFRDAQHAAAEMAAQDSELHRDIMNLQVNDEH